LTIAPCLDRGFESINDSIPSGETLNQERFAERNPDVVNNESGKKNPNLKTPSVCD